jgi:hypothetical protein
MVSKWTHPNEDERATLEELRHHFNRQILKTAMERSGMDIVPGEVKHAYESLFVDDLNNSDEEDIRLRLEHNGVALDEITDEFVNSPQTIHNYLRDVHDVDLKRDTDGENRKEKARKHIKSLDRRYETVIEDLLDGLISDGELEDAEYQVTVDCFVENTETNQTRHIQDIIQD